MQWYRLYTTVVIAYQDLGALLDKPFQLPGGSISRRNTFLLIARDLIELVLK